MSQPQAYERTRDFTEQAGDETDHAGLNAELDAAALTINQIRGRLELLQRDDGTLIITLQNLGEIADELDAAIAASQAASNNASSSAAAATTAKNAAEAANTSAINARNAAQASAASASGSAASASASAAAASASASSASASASAASGSASAAAGSASAALASENAAELAESNAVTAKNAAEAANTAAQAAKTTAETKAGEASASATAAAGSATAASGSASAAAASAANLDAYLDVAPNEVNASRSLALADRGECLDLVATGMSITVEPDATVNFPVGAVVSVCGRVNGTNTLAQGTDVTLRMAGTTNTGNRTLGAYCMVTLRKVAANTWLVAGAGLS